MQLRRADDVVVIAEDFEEFACQRCGVIGAAGVGHRLAATSSWHGEVHRAAEPLQQFQRGPGDLRVQLVNVTGDEQANVHGCQLSVVRGQWQNPLQYH